MDDAAKTDEYVAALVPKQPSVRPLFGRLLVLVLSGAVISGTWLAWKVWNLRNEYRALQKQHEQLRISSVSIRNDPDAVPGADELRLYNEADEPRLRAALATVFPSGYAHLSGEERGIEILRFVSSHIAIGPVERFKQSAEYLDDQAASCGGFAMVFSDLARLTGLPARYLGIFGFSHPTYGVGSHALAEVYYDGAWHMFDPTFGVFFYSHPTPTPGRHVLSAKEVMTWAAFPELLQVVSKPWLKNYAQERHHGVERVGTQPTSHVLTYWNDHNRKAAFPVAYGNASSASFPVHVNLHSTPVFEVGKIDGSHHDVYLDSAARSSVGYFYLGGQVPHAMQTVVLEGAVGARARIEYVAQDDAAPVLSFLPLDAMHVLSSTRNGRHFRFEVQLNAPRSMALVTSPAGLFWVDALQVHALPDTSP